MSERETLGVAMRGVSPEEATAVTAAVEQFVAGAAPVVPAPEVVGAWKRAALTEGCQVSASASEDPTRLYELRLYRNHDDS